MANLAETATYDAGVYQLELTDPVIGGPSGISNAPLKNLANRTAWLKDAVDTASSGLSDHLASATPHAAASATVSGIVELATNAETQTGTDSARAVTPAGLASKVASESAAGLIELATTAEVQTGTDTTRAVTAAGLAARTATETRAGVIELATVAEVQAGTDATRAVTVAGLVAMTATDIRAGVVELATSTETQSSNDGTRAITPAGLKSVLVGAVQLFAMASTPAGWLKCNGAAVSRTTYTVLFAAIGTTFGAGDGSTTFNLPDLRGEFLRGWDDARGIDSGRVFGSWQKGTLVAWDDLTGTWGISNDTTTATAATTQAAVGADAYTTSDYNATLGLEGLASTASQALPGAAGAAWSGVTRPRNIALLACIKY